MCKCGFLHCSIQKAADFVPFSKLENIILPIFKHGLICSPKPFPPVRPSNAGCWWRGAGAKRGYVSVLWFRLGVIFLLRVCVQSEGVRQVAGAAVHGTAGRLRRTAEQRRPRLRLALPGRHGAAGPEAAPQVPVDSGEFRNWIDFISEWPCLSFKVT